jgi:hypothetical protein
MNIVAVVRYLYIIENCIWLIASLVLLLNKKLLYSSVCAVLLPVFFLFLECVIWERGIIELNPLTCIFCSIPRRIS